MNALTQKYDHNETCIASHCAITPAYKNLAEVKEPMYCETKSTMWDTGADVTIISKEVAEALHLTPVRKAAISGIGGLVYANVYKINLYILGKVKFEELEVFDGELEDYDMIIGMDIISKGDFAITNKDEETWFSFRFPSQEHISFE